MKSILFICSANICRSPMAEGLLLMKTQSLPGPWRVESAGVWALIDSPAAENTLRVLNKRGVDLSMHTARQITHKLALQFNLILTMERSHKEVLQAAMPELADRIFLLSEMVSKTYDIADPIGGMMEDYEDTAHDLEKIFEHGWEQISRLAGG